MNSDIARHAHARLQQRAIPPMVVELLERFGSTMRCGDAERVFFDRKALKRIRHYLGGDRGLTAIERWLNVYVIIADNGRVVTAAHKTGRFVRP